MFRVSGNQISITAGDTALMAICPDETGYVPTANDRAIFTVRERPKRRALIEKTIAPEADGRFVVCFESEDTARLKPREYVWDVRLAIQANVDENGEVTDAEQIITPCPPGMTTPANDASLTSACSTEIGAWNAGSEATSARALASQAGCLRQYLDFRLSGSTTGARPCCVATTTSKPASCTAR